MNGFLSGDYHNAFMVTKGSLPVRSAVCGCVLLLLCVCVCVCVSEHTCAFVIHDACVCVYGCVTGLMSVSNDGQR